MFGSGLLDFIILKYNTAIRKGYIIKIARTIIAREEQKDSVHDS